MPISYKSVGYGIISMSTDLRRTTAARDRSAVTHAVQYLRAYRRGDLPPRYPLPVTIHVSDTCILARAGLFATAAAWDYLQIEEGQNELIGKEESAISDWDKSELSAPMSSSAAIARQVDLDMVQWRRDAGA